MANTKHGSPKGWGRRRMNKTYRKGRKNQKKQITRVRRARDKEALREDYAPTRRELGHES